MRAHSIAWALSAACAAMAVADVRADTIVYGNDFESNTVGTTGGGVTTTGFTAAGTLGGKTLTGATLNLHAPSAGTANNTKWLGMFNSGSSGSSGATVALGRNVSKVSASPPGSNPARNETVSLTLSNLTEGATYSVAFDLLVGESWDGAAASFGGDFWYFSANGTRLVDTIFSNVSNGALGDPYHDAGAYSPQKYTDTNYASPTGADVDRFTGADAYYYGGSPNASVYSDIYAIYSFGRGAGNPTLRFVAGTSKSVTLEWGRYSGSSDSADESWALDNVTVSTSASASAAAAVPFPGALPGGAACLAGLLACRCAGRARSRRGGTAR